MSALRICISLLLVSAVLCQYRDRVYNTGRSRSGSTRYGQSRTSVSSSRYNVYRPLDTYRTQYGSNIVTQNRSVVSSTRHQYGQNNPSRSQTTYTHYSHTRNKGATSSEHSGFGTERSRQSVQATTIPHVESSYGLTHYGTLKGRQGQSRDRGSQPRPYTPPQGRLEGRLGKKKQRIAGEGYGEAYLEWSEYGIGEAVYD